MKFFHHDVKSRLDWTASVDVAVAVAVEGGAKAALACPPFAMAGGGVVNYTGPPSRKAITERITEARLVDGE